MNTVADSIKASEMSGPPRSFHELIERYRQGERNFADSELDADSNNDLSGICLDGADLSRSYIAANFRNARLRGVRFKDANLKTCDFSEADLRAADFRGAALCSTSFHLAKLEGADFTGAFVHSHVFKTGECPFID